MSGRQSTDRTSAKAGASAQARQKSAKAGASAQAPQAQQKSAKAGTSAQARRKSAPAPANGNNSGLLSQNPTALAFLYNVNPEFKVKKIRSLESLPEGVYGGYRIKSQHANAAEKNEYGEHTLRIDITCRADIPRRRVNGQCIEGDPIITKIFIQMDPFLLLNKFENLHGPRGPRNSFFELKTGPPTKSDPIGLLKSFFEITNDNTITIYKSTSDTGGMSVQTLGTLAMRMDKRVRGGNRPNLANNVNVDDIMRDIFIIKYALDQGHRSLTYKIGFKEFVASTGGLPSGPDDDKTLYRQLVLITAPSVLWKKGQRLFLRDRRSRGESTQTFIEAPEGQTRNFGYQSEEDSDTTNEGNVLLATSPTNKAIRLAQMGIHATVDRMSAFATLVIDCIPGRAFHHGGTIYIHEKEPHLFSNENQKRHDGKDYSNFFFRRKMIGNNAMSPTAYQQLLMFHLWLNSNEIADQLIILDKESKAQIKGRKPGANKQDWVNAEAEVKTKEIPGIYRIFSSGLQWKKFLSVMINSMEDAGGNMQNIRTKFNIYNDVFARILKFMEAIHDFLGCKGNRCPDVIIDTRAKKARIEKEIELVEYGGTRPNSSTTNLNLEKTLISTKKSKSLKPANKKRITQSAKGKWESNANWQDAKTQADAAYNIWETLCKNRLISFCNAQFPELNSNFKLYNSYISQIYDYNGDWNSDHVETLAANFTIFMSCIYPDLLERARNLPGKVNVSKLPVISKNSRLSIDKLAEYVLAFEGTNDLSACKCYTNNKDYLEFKPSKYIQAVNVSSTESHPDTFVWVKSMMGIRNSVNTGLVILTDAISHRPTGAFGALTINRVLNRPGHSGVETELARMLKEIKNNNN